MGDIQHGGQVEFAAGRRWQRLVDAYREDFDSRGESKLSVHFDGLNICRRNQERPCTRLQPGANAGSSWLSRLAMPVGSLDRQIVLSCPADLPTIC